MAGRVLDYLIIEELDLGIVLLNVAFDLTMHALQLVKTVFLKRRTQPVLSAVHNFIAKLLMQLYNPTIEILFSHKYSQYRK
jgi:hypothetical protein